MPRRGIHYEDLKNAILTGEIIEQYSTDYPLPSCLVLGLSIRKKYLHVVCAIKQNAILIITAYLPDPEKWESDLKTRRRNQ